MFLLKQNAACLTADGAYFFPLFFKKSFPYFGGFLSRLIYYLAPAFSKIIYAGALFIYLSSPNAANYFLTNKHLPLFTNIH